MYGTPLYLYAQYDIFGIVVLLSHVLAVSAQLKKLNGLRRPHGLDRQTNITKAGLNFIVDKIQLIKFQ